MRTSKTVKINASQFEDHDDCLTAAAEDYASQHGLEGWDLAPRWEDGGRDVILLDVPRGAGASKPWTSIN